MEVRRSVDGATSWREARRQRSAARGAFFARGDSQRIAVGTSPLSLRAPEIKESFWWGERVCGVRGGRERGRKT